MNVAILLALDPFCTYYTKYRFKKTERNCKFASFFCAPLRNRTTSILPLQVVAYAVVTFCLVLAATIHNVQHPVSFFYCELFFCMDPKTEFNSNWYYVFRLPSWIMMTCDNITRVYYISKLADLASQHRLEAYSRRLRFDLTNGRVCALLLLKRHRYIRIEYENTFSLLCVLLCSDIAVQFRRFQVYMANGSSVTDTTYVLCMIITYIQIFVLIMYLTVRYNFSLRAQLQCYLREYSPALSILIRRTQVGFGNMFGVTLDFKICLNVLHELFSITSFIYALTKEQPYLMKSKN